MLKDSQVSASLGRLRWKKERVGTETGREEGRPEEDREASLARFRGVHHSRPSRRVRLQPRRRRRPPHSLSFLPHLRRKTRSSSCDRHVDIRPLLPSANFPRNLLHPSTPLPHVIDPRLRLEDSLPSPVSRAKSQKSSSNPFKSEPPTGSSRRDRLGSLPRPRR